MPRATQNKQSDVFEAEIARLTAENAALKVAKNGGSRGLAVGVGPSGVVMVKGLNARFPVSLYGNQWDRLMSDIVGENWQATVEAPEGFGEDFLCYVKDAMEGPVDSKGKPMGNAAHIARREAAAAARDAKAS